jgi:hypothetical protein
LTTCRSDNDCRSGSCVFGGHPLGHCM